MSSEYSSEAVLPVEGVMTEPKISEPLDDAQMQEAARILALRDAETARALRFFALMSFAVIVADQISKAWVRAALTLNIEHEVIPGWLSFSHILNKGAAWGMLSGQRWFLIAITLFVMVIVSQMAREFAPHSAMARLGLGLILGGAIGNLIDRIWQGAVTDFIDLQTPIEWIRTFPVFNIADSALTVGVIVLLIDFIGHRREIPTLLSGKVPANSPTNSEIS